MNIEEAKDILANCIADYVIGDYCVGKYCPMEDECKDKDCTFEVAIDTVLNKLEKKEAEIDKLRNTNKDLLKKLRNRVKEVKKLTRYSLYKKEFARLNKQLKKKNKIIDLMAEELRYYKRNGTR